MTFSRLVLLSVLAGTLAHAGGKNKNRAFSTGCEAARARTAYSSRQTFEERLAEMIPDPAQRVKMGRGAEGDVFQSTVRADRALKVWRNGDMSQFMTSVSKLMAMKEVLDTKRAERLRCCLSVTKIYNIGTNWIERDFFPSSIPIREALKSDGKARKAYEKVIEELRDLRGHETLKLIYDKLKEQKPNFHWNPETQQIVIIDSQ